jgi:hypothetical protein
MSYKPLSLEVKLSIVEKAIHDYKGQLPEIERAIGILFVGEQFGWKVIYLVHDKKTIRKYQKILGVNFREVFPERGPLAHRSVALTLADRAGNFWKSVTGQIPGIRKPDIK